MANPPYKPTEEQRKTVELLAAMGVCHEDICKIILGPRGKPIDDKTLRKHFRPELDTAAIRANQQVAGALFKMATDPKGGMKAVTAQIFWLKTRARWRETASLEVSGPEGGPLNMTHAFAVPLLEDDMEKWAATHPDPTSR